MPALRQRSAPALREAGTLHGTPALSCWCQQAQGRYEQRAREPKASAHLRLSHCSLSSFFSLRVDAAAERDARKAEKQAKKALAFGPKPQHDWITLEGMWPAYAVDGKGYHDGDGKYTCQIPVEDFGEHLFLGGEARMYLCGGAEQVFRLPSAAPPARTVLTFRLQVEQRLVGGLGRLTMIDGVEVRAPSQ